MNKKIMRKFISVFLAVQMILSCGAVFASSGMMGNFFGGTEVSMHIDDPGGKMTGMVNGVLGLLQYAGFAIAIGMTIYAGMKYMMSAANEKAELKQSSVRLVVGAIIVAGISGIFPVIFGLFMDLPNA